jgi:hypothetical protein
MHESQMNSSKAKRQRAKMAGVPVLLRRPVGMASSPASVCSDDDDVICECSGVGLLVGRLCLSVVSPFFSEGLYVIFCYE